MAPPACARRAGPVLQRLSASVCASERKSAGSPARVVTVGRRRQRGRRIRSGTGHRLRNRDLRASPVRRRATWRRGRVPVRTRWVCAGRVSRHEHQGTGTGIGRVWGRVRRFGTGYSGPETTNPLPNGPRGEPGPNPAQRMRRGPAHQPMRGACPDRGSGSVLLAGLQLVVVLCRLQLTRGDRGDPVVEEKAGQGPADLLLAADLPVLIRGGRLVDGGLEGDQAVAVVLVQRLVDLDELTVRCRDRQIRRVISKAMNGPKKNRNRST